MESSSPSDALAPEAIWRRRAASSFIHQTETDGRTPIDQRPLDRSPDWTSTFTADTFLHPPSSFFNLMKKNGSVMSFQRFPRGFPNFGSRPQLGGHDPKSGRRRFVPIFAIRRNPKMLTGIPQLWVTTPELGGSRPHKRPTPLRVLCSRFTELYRVLRNMDIHCRL